MALEDSLTPGNHCKPRWGEEVRVRSRVRSILVVGMASLVLGVVSTYAVAWVLMNRRVFVYPGVNILFHDPEVGTPGWNVAMESRVGAVWLVADGSYLNPDARGAYLSEAGHEGRAIQVPAWSLVNRVSPNELFPGWNSTNLARCQFWERAAGWPRIAVVEREEADPPGVWPTRERGASVRVGGNGDAWSGVVLAFEPVWGGFVLDVGVYGVLWGGVIWGACALWRLLRLRDGRCPVCRYDLSGLVGGVCPECGTMVGK